MRIALIVNGTAHEISAPPKTPLLGVLRNRLDLKGTRFGCGLAQCGACMVLVDGEPVYACTREVGTLAGAQITTVEALDGYRLRTAFLAEQAASAAIVFPAS